MALFDDYMAHGRPAMLRMPNEARDRRERQIRELKATLYLATGEADNNDLIDALGLSRWRDQLRASGVMPR